MDAALRKVLARADGLLRKRQADEARGLLEAFALESASSADAAEFQAVLTQACLQSGATDAALTAIQRVLLVRPQWADAHLLHALALARFGLLDDAAHAIDRALKLRPDDVRGWTNLGSVERRRGRLADAESALRRAITLAPDFAAAWRDLAQTLQASGQDDAAVEAWRRWVSLESEGGDGRDRARAQARASFGWALAGMHRWKHAEDELEAAASAPGGDAVAATRLGFVRRERGDADGALAAFGEASRWAPELLTPRIGTALFLPQVYADAADVRQWRARYYAGLDQLESKLPQLLGNAAALWQLDWSNFYLGYQGEDDLPLQRRYADLVRSLASAAAPAWTAHLDRRIPSGRRPRIGLASSFFRASTVGSYFGPWVTGLDPARFEVLAFSFGTESDSTTAAIRRGVERFVHTAPDVRQIAATIREAALDVLIYPQVGMDGRDATLAALRLAPTQCAAWGHPETTGSGAIDFYFSCADMEPEGAERYYSEQLLLLPGLGTRYARPGVRLASRSEFGFPERGRLYVCPHSLFKIHPDNDSMFVELLQRDPDGWLVLCADPAEPATARFSQRLQRNFRAVGIDCDRRFIFQPLRPPPDFRAMLSVCDVMLDTQRWSGGNTSLDALAAGLPIVTPVGRLMRGRQSAAMLRAIGLDALVADSPSAAVVKAIETAHDSEAIRRQIVRDRDGLFDRPEPIRLLGAHLLRICEGQQ